MAIFSKLIRFAAQSFGRSEYYERLKTLKNLVKIKVYEKCSFTNYFIPRYDGGLLLDLGSGSSQFFYAA